MNRPVINVAIEALVIGVMNATLIYGINKVDPTLESPFSTSSQVPSSTSSSNTLVVTNGGVRQLTKPNQTSPADHSEPYTSHPTHHSFPE